MNDKSHEEKLAIAKQAYKQIKKAIDSFEKKDTGICVYWDECISVDDELFHGRHLKEEDCIMTQKPAS